MNGVIVHAEHIYRGIPVWGLVIVLAILVATFAYILSLYLKALADNSIKKWYTHIIMIAVAATTVFLGVLCIDNWQLIHKEQVITIDDTVSFNEFFDHYEIISIDGNLYTVKEIEIENTEPEVPSYD